MRLGRALLLFVFVFTLTDVSKGARGGRGGRKKGKGGKSMLPFGNIDEYSLESEAVRHPEGATIALGSHWTQLFRLGYKILLLCVAEGQPLPGLTWYKDGAELYPRRNAHISEKRSGGRIWSRLEIDPAAMGDQGIYSCLANNAKGIMVKNFRAEYTY